MQIIPLESFTCAPELARSLARWLNEVHATELTSYEKPVGLSVRYAGPQEGFLLTVRAAEPSPVSEPATSLVGKYVRIVEGQNTDWFYIMGVVKSHNLETGMLSVYLNHLGLQVDNLHVSEVKVIDRPKKKEEE